MKRTLIIVPALLFMLSMQRGPTAMAHTHPENVVVEFPGATVTWLAIAAPEFHQKGLNLNNYTVSVVDAQDSVLVVLTPSGQPKEVRGSIGKHPGYAVEISKESMKVLRSYYTR